MEIALSDFEQRFACLQEAIAYSNAADAETVVEIADCFLAFCQRKETKDIRDSIKNLDIQPRNINALSAEGILSINLVLGFSNETLLGVPGFGPASLADLDNALDRQGLRRRKFARRHTEEEKQKLDDIDALNKRLRGVDWNNISQDELHSIKKEQERLGLCKY